MTKDETLGPAGLRVAQLRNALLILNAAGHTLHQVASMVAGDVGPLDIGFRASDVADLRRLLTEAIELATAEHLELQTVRRNLERAMADRRRLELAIGAPQPRGVIPTVDAEGQEVLAAALSDGSVHFHYPDRVEGQRWVLQEPIPTTRAAILAETALEAAAA